MIHVFPAGFVKPGAKAGYATITFEMDDSNRDMYGAMINSPMGKQFLLVAYEIGEDAGEIEKLHNNKGHAKQVLMRQVHGIIGEYSEKTGVPQDKIKNILRIYLKGKKKLVESLSELDETGLASAIYNLRVYLNPDRFDYSEYLENEDSENRGS